MASDSAAAPALDVLIVSLGATQGLRAADRELRDSLARAGARVEIAQARPPRQLRTLMLTDLAWARAARAAALRNLAQPGHSPPRAIVYSSTTAALLWPRPGAIRFDAPSAGNRPGHHGLWQRPLERRRLAQASLLLPWSEGGLLEAPEAARGGDRALVLPVAVEPSGPMQSSRDRDIAAVTYAANPTKKGLDRVLAAWSRVRDELSPDAPRELVVAGLSASQFHASVQDGGEWGSPSLGMGVDGVAGVRTAGVLAPAEFRALLRRARVFICAPRREDYGIAQLEALAEGCMLVTTPAPGPYVALPIARSLDARLVSEDLAGALRAALLEAPIGYAVRAREAMTPFGREAVDRLVGERLLPRLLTRYATAG